MRLLGAILLSAVALIGAPIKVTTTSLAGGTVGLDYSASLSASGGTTPYAWTLSGGTLPGGLALSADGSISGSPTSSGTFNFTVRATSAGNSSDTDTQALSIVIAPKVTISTGSLPGGQAGTAYSQTLHATGGTTPYTWSISAGSLPQGLTLSGAIISGTPSGPETANFTVQVTDKNSATDTQALSIAISPAPVSITTTSLPGGQTGTPYSQTLQASGGTGSYTWSMTAGSLPQGLSLGASGEISGTPTASGPSNFTVKAVSGSGSDTQALSISITATPVSITTTSLPSGQVGVAYSQTLQASGGTGTYTWSLASGTLPGGLTLSGSGQIAGTPTASGPSSFTVKATSGPGSDTQALSISITVAPVTITTTSLPSGQVGVAYSQALQASGGTGTYTWSISSGALPGGLTLNASGQISGTPTASGPSSFTVKAVSGSDSATGPLSISITAAPLTITTTSLPGGQVGVAYSQTLQASGGTGTYTWSLASGTLSCRPHAKRVRPDLWDSHGFRTFKLHSEGQR